MEWNVLNLIELNLKGIETNWFLMEKILMDWLGLDVIGFELNGMEII